VTEHFAIMVPGARAAGRGEVRSPWDRSVVGTVDLGDNSAADRALATATALSRDRDRRLPAAKRIEILDRAGAIMKERREMLAREAAREGGKPLADSLVEADRAIDGVRLCAETLRAQAGREVPMGINAASSERLAFTRLEPVGVVVAFSAFNHPLNLIVHQAAPAVAAGCPVIVKPAEAAPLSCMRFTGILREAGLPPEWCQAILTTDLDVAGALAADPRVDFFSFIGSAKVGWMLRARLAPGARCALEHGGAAPVVAAEDADLDQAVPVLAKGGFYHAGQVCVSVQRVYAARAIAHNFAERLAQRAAAMTVGDPLLPATEVGPLIRPAEVRRVDEWVREAAAGGGDVLCGGRPLSETCYAPTVILDPPEEARVSREEVFGPVVCVYAYNDIDGAIARANALPYAFQAAVFTRDIDTALRAARRLDASAVMVNDHTAFRVDWMPFAGLRRSGLGVGGIPATMRDMQVEKLIVVRSKELA
jgi:acyl-CoA reductase-like NAD-dependent aldehyde dehydrogenase